MYTHEAFINLTAKTPLSFCFFLEDTVLAKNIAQSIGVELCVLGYLIDDVGEIREEVALVLVSKDGRNTGIIELDLVVVHLDKVDSWMGGNERREGLLDDLTDTTLLYD